MTEIIQKDKGDTGLVQVIADLDKHKIKIAIPLSEHLPFDVIAINQAGQLSRVSIKYKSMSNGLIAIPLRSISTNMKGWKAKTIDFSDIDAMAIYCPDTEHCYYIPSSFLKDCKSTFTLRVSDSKKNRKDIHWARDYFNPNVLFHWSR